MADFYLDSDLEVPAEGTLARVLYDFGNEMQADLRQSLRESDNYVTGDLAEQIQFSTKLFGTNMVFELSLSDYYDYVNKGVNGTKTVKNNTPFSYKASSKVPFGYAKEWMNNKGLFATPGTTFSSRKTGKTYKAGSKDSQAFAMAKSWKEQGTKGSGFYDRVVTPDRLKRLMRDITKASANNMQTIIAKTANGIFGKSK